MTNAAVEYESSLDLARKSKEQEERNAGTDGIIDELPKSECPDSLREGADFTNLDRRALELQAEISRLIRLCVSHVGELLEFKEKKSSQVPRADSVVSLTNAYIEACRDYENKLSKLSDMLAIACFDAKDIGTYEKDLNDIQTQLTNAAVEYATSYEASLQQLQHGVTKLDCAFNSTYTDAQAAKVASNGVPADDEKPEVVLETEGTGVRMQKRLDLGLIQGSVQQNPDIVEAMAEEESIEDVESNASTNTEGALSQARKMAKQVPGQDVLSQLVKLRKNTE